MKTKRIKSLMEKVCSLQKADNHKVLSIFGLKIKLKHRSNTLKLQKLERQSQDILRILNDKYFDIEIYMKTLISFRTTNAIKVYQRDNIDFVKKINRFMEHNLIEYSQFLRWNGLADKETIKNILKFAITVKSTSWPIMNLIEQIWYYEGVTDELLEYGDIFHQRSDAKANAFKQAWLMYIASLYELGHTAKAQTILTTYMDRHGCDLMERYLPVASFANQFVDHDSVKKAALIFEKLEATRKNMVFEELIKGKTIAIVGNGPSEVGKSKGKEIDAHDIVIRFNNYNNSDNFVEDYGSKTDIWVRGSGGRDVVDREDVSEYKLIMWEGDYWHYPLHHNHFDILNRYVSDDVTVGYFDYETHLSLRNASGIMFPTTGLVTIWHIYNILGSFANVDLYGFSFLQDEVLDYASHYYNDYDDVMLAKKRSAPHSFSKESQFICQIYKKETK